MRKNSKNSLSRKLFGNKIKRQNLKIPDSTTQFFEEIPLYRDAKSKKTGRIYRIQSRRTTTKN
jgi:hypothetical protein